MSTSNELKGLTHEQISLITTKQQLAKEIVTTCKEGAETDNNNNGWILFNKQEGVRYFQKQTSFGLMLVGKGVCESPPRVIFDVLGEGRIEYRKELEINLDTSVEIEKINPSTKILLNRYKGVPFVKPREFLILLHKTEVNENNEYMLLGTSLSSHSACPLSLNYERGSCYLGGWIIQPHETNPFFSNVTYIACANLGGSLPLFITDKIAQQQPAQVATLNKILKRDHSEKSKRSLPSSTSSTSSLMFSSSTSASAAASLVGENISTATIKEEDGEEEEAKALSFPPSLSSSLSSRSRPTTQKRSNKKKENLLKKEGTLYKYNNDEKKWEKKWVKLQGITLSCKENAQEAGLNNVIHLTSISYLIEGPFLQEEKFYCFSLIPSPLSPLPTFIDFSVGSSSSSPLSASSPSSLDSASISSFLSIASLTSPTEPNTTELATPQRTSTPTHIATPVTTLQTNTITLKPTTGAILENALVAQKESFRTEDANLCEEWLFAIKENIKLSGVVKLQKKLKAERKTLISSSNNKLEPNTVITSASTNNNNNNNDNKALVSLSQKRKKSLLSRLLFQPWTIIFLLFLIIFLKIKRRERLIELFKKLKQRQL